MTKQLKLAAVAAALLLSTGAYAKLKPMDSYDGSLTFFAVNTSGSPTSMVVDLGMTLSSAYTIDAANFTGGAPTPLFSAPGTTIQWNLGANTLTVNGASQAGTYNWSSVKSFFDGAIGTGPTTWGVMAGASQSYPNYYLTTGNPSDLQLTNQTADFTSSMYLSDLSYTANNIPATGASTRSTLSLTGAGAGATTGLTTSASGYVLAGGNLGPFGNWQGNTKWTALTAEGAANTSPLWVLEDDLDGATRFAGTFNYDAGVLTYTVAVPEPQTYALFGAGLLVLTMLRRRRG